MRCIETRTRTTVLLVPMNRPRKKIALVDAGRKPEIIEAVLRFIADRYDLVRTDDVDADYVFHSCLGNEVLKYSGIRIFVTGENVSPNFNISDYALAFDTMQFCDRYVRLPLFKLYAGAYKTLCMPRPPADEILTNKEGFCAYVMSNMKDGAPERTQLYDLLSAYKPVASGGKWRNNVGAPVDDKITFQSKYKFVIACENSSTPGYLTEKFAQAAQSNAVPIYWGDPTIAEQFNPEAFVNCHDFDSLEAVAERVKHIDSDDILYKQILSEPWFPDGKEPDQMKDDFFADFLANIFDQPKESAYRRNRSRWGIKQEKTLYNMAFRPHVHAAKMLKKRRRK